MLNKKAPTPINNLIPKSKPVYFIQLNRIQTLRLSAYAIIMLFLGAALFQSIIITGSSVNNITFQNSLFIVLSYIVTLILHELVHGIAFKIFGGHPTYGGGFLYFMPYFYATAGEKKFPLLGMVCIAISPFIVLSIAFLLGALIFPQFSTYFAIAFIGNFSGAVGDLWMIKELMIFRTYRNVYVIDKINGLSVYSEDYTINELLIRLTSRSSEKLSFINLWLFGTVTVFLLSLLIYIAGPFFQKTLLLGPANFPLVSYSITNNTARFTFNILPPIVFGLVFAILSTLLLRKKK